MPIRLLLGVLLAASVATAAAAKAPSLTRREQQLAACSGDMQRLCPGSMSDSKKLKTCIRPKKALVGATCRAWLDVPE